MKTETVKLQTVELRAYAGHRAHAPNLTTRYALIAHDIAEDRNPEHDARLVGNARAAMARGEFEFTIQ